MDTIINAIEAWMDLVVKLYGGHPLAAALLTLIGVGLFMDLEKNRLRGETGINILIVG